MKEENADPGTASHVGWVVGNPEVHMYVLGFRKLSDRWSFIGCDAPNTSETSTLGLLAASPSILTCDCSK